jgi:signal transduction histidine kinase
VVPVRNEAAEEERWLNRLLTDVARGPESSWGYHVRIDRRDDEPRVLATRLMPTEWGDTAVYAVEYEPAHLDSILGAVLAANDLLPAAVVEGRSNGDVLDLEVLDAMGIVLFRHGAQRVWDFDATAQLPPSYGGLVVRAHVRDDMAEAILIGGVPQSRVPILLVILALALGLTLLAAVQLRREVRFAAERATFVANVSHELRTPLSQIRLAVETLRLGRAPDAGSRDHALAVADREALRLQHLVEGVLRFSRGSRSAEDLRHSTDAAQEARAVVSEFEALATPHRVTVELAGASSVPMALHRGALRQVLLNLFDNAVKYGGDGTEIRVRLDALLRGGARLIVDDNGPGVPPAERDRIWQPFERGGEARRRAAGGSGIGLTIVREIAQEHGGTAWVEDAPGGGARFIVELPDERQA